MPITRALVALACVAAPVAAVNTVLPSELRFTGRTNVTGLGAVQFDNPGVSVELPVTLNSKAVLRMSQYLGPNRQDHNFLVIVDGVAITEPFDGNDCAYCTFDTSRAAATDAVLE